VVQRLLRRLERAEAGVCSRDKRGQKQAQQRVLQS
jgi:hypothetical protein